MLMQPPPITCIEKHIPILSSLRTYQKTFIRADLIAGLTTAAIVIPQSMAYATIAGLPIEVGLYASLVPMVVYALLGTSRVLSVSVTSSISLLTASILASAVPSADVSEMLVAAGTLAILVGLLLILAGILKLGFLANFISAPVLTGFKAGLGVVIFAGQIGKALGYSVPKGGFLQTIVKTIQGLDQANWPSILITLIVLAILIFLPRLKVRFPAVLAAIAASILAAAVLNRMGAHVKLVEGITPGLPSLQMPNLSLIEALLPGALGIALMSFSESIAASHAFAQQSDPPINANRELLALGSANVIGGFFQAYPVGGGTSQTAFNREMGAKTQVAALVTALTVALTLLFLAPLVNLIPNPALGAMLLVTAVKMINPGEFAAIKRYRNTELIWAVVAFVGVVLLGTLRGILVAVGLSVLMLLYTANHPKSYALGRKRGTNFFRSLEEHPDDETYPGLLIMRTEGWMNFASLPNARDKLFQLLRETEPRVVILECSAIIDIEYTALLLLLQAERKLSSTGITLWLVGLNPELDVRIRTSPLGKNLGDERIFLNLDHAVGTYMKVNPLKIEDKEKED